MRRKLAVVPGVAQNKVGIWAPFVSNGMLPHGAKRSDQDTRVVAVMMSLLVTIDRLNGKWVVISCWFNKKMDG